MSELTPREPPEQVSSITIECSPDMMAFIEWRAVGSAETQHIVYRNGEAAGYAETDGYWRTVVRIEPGDTIRAEAWDANGNPAARPNETTCFENWPTTTTTTTPETVTTTTQPDVLPHTGPDVGMGVPSLLMVLGLILVWLSRVVVNATT